MSKARVLAAVLIAGATLLALNFGFVRALNPTPRALIAEWDSGSRVVPPRSKATFWTAGSPIVWRAAEGGPRFAVLPTTHDAAVAKEVRPVDRAEVGQAVECAELAADAVATAGRERILYTLAGCAPELELASSDPRLDAARVLTGHPAARPEAIAAVAVELPLDLADAVVLAAQLELAITAPATRAVTDGSPYDRAVLLAALRPAGTQALRARLEALCEEVPLPAGAAYHGALEALKQLD